MFRKRNSIVAWSQGNPEPALAIRRERGHHSLFVCDVENCIRERRGLRSFLSGLNWAGTNGPTVITPSIPVSTLDCVCAEQTQSDIISNIRSVRRRRDSIS